MQAQMIECHVLQEIVIARAQPNPMPARAPLVVLLMRTVTRDCPG